jgi:peptidoglycan/xylan/chitin deacetylase (PgdA/CDA1 family)
VFRLLRTLKRTALNTLERGGGYRLIGNSRWRRQTLLLLAYHGISQDDEHRWNPALYISQQMLAERVRILREARCTILPLAEAVERLYSGTLPERSLSVTFDDGYYNFVSHAYPLLAEYAIPVTLYLRTAGVGSGTPVFPLICSYIFWKSGRIRVELPGVRRQPFNIATASDRKAAIVEILSCSARERFSTTDRAAVVERLAASVGFDYEATLHKRLFQLMSPDDVTRLSSAGVDFQLHTHTHNTPRDAERFASEITKNRECIEEWTGKRASHFCYPSGDYHPLFLPWLQQLGVISATTCDPGLASRHTPPLLIPRFMDTSTTTATEFRGWVTGAAALLSRCRSYAHALL